MLSFKKTCHIAFQSGFTLIELMMVIAIVGILAAIALPAYQDYTVRAKLSELVLAASSCRTSVIDVIQSSSVVNVSNFLLNTCNIESTKYVKSVTVDANGMITVLADEANLAALTTASNALTLVPIQTANTAFVGTTDGGKTIAGWRCGSLVDGTTIPTKYLPSLCKGAY
jgi:type IV pilus assembly protein PilA